MQPANAIQVVGFDPSLRNWGVAKGVILMDQGVLRLDEVAVIQPILPTGKQVRQNSSDLESAYQLAMGALEHAKGAQAIFVEVPVGSQSARAMASYGICVGVLGALRATGIPFFEVTPAEVKIAACKNSQATKKDMIAWAMSQHPEANWPMYKQNGELLLSEAKAEHMADATGAIYAGVRTNSFKQTLHLMNASSVRKAA
jgi:Holliday junction resolvasome RuvABC endonuclease subunit